MEQHDCQEFLRFYLGELQDELNPVNMPKPLGASSVLNLPSIKNSNGALNCKYQEHKALHNSIIDRLFSGMLMNTLQCQKCMKTSRTIDPFLDLSI